MSHDDETYVKRPMPVRPKFAWRAWEATIGYIHQKHSPDVTLGITIAPMTHYIGWSASLKWGQDIEEVENRHSFPIALNDLWAKIEQNHRLIDTMEAATRRPVNYSDDNILDDSTNQVFSSLVNSTDTVFSGDWQIMVSYRPIETPSKRVQTRLTADNYKVNRGGNGATLREACRNLLRNTALVFHQYRNQKSEQ